LLHAAIPDFCNDPNASQEPLKRPSRQAPVETRSQLADTGRQFQQSWQRQVAALGAHLAAQQAQRRQDPDADGSMRRHFPAGPVVPGRLAVRNRGLLGARQQSAEQAPKLVRDTLDSVQAGARYLRALMVADHREAPDRPGIPAAWTTAEAMAMASGRAGLLLFVLLCTATLVGAQGPSPFYNAPADRLVITEVNWSTWTSQVQITDVTGGSRVRAYYYSGANQRGPFELWDNSSGGPMASVAFANILEELDKRDDDPDFVYFGTSGALELMTQGDGFFLIQAAVRTSNTGVDGHSSRTFPALADVEENTANYGGRQLLIPNLSNNAEYRSSVVLFNSSGIEAVVHVALYDGNGNQIGSTVDRDLGPYEMNVITDELRAPLAPFYSNATAVVTVTSVNCRVMASGQTAHNTTDDPAAHLAVQLATGPTESGASQVAADLAALGAPVYANSPEQSKLIPEVNWTDTWVSEVTIVDVTGGSTVHVYYDSGTGGRRGPFELWDNSSGGPLSSVTFANILEKLDELDLVPGSAYFGTSGALELSTQGAPNLIHAAVRTHNGAGHSRTFPALGVHEANTASLTRSLLIPNISNDGDYRCSVVLLNPTSASTTVAATIFDHNGLEVGDPTVRTLAGHEDFVMTVITDALQDSTYSNATIRLDVTGGDGYILATGQTADNVSDDPAAHIAVQATQLERQ
jgi:hypothetical protein